jgi:hypothetical protein
MIESRLWQFVRREVHSWLEGDLRRGGRTCEFEHGGLAGLPAKMVGLWSQVQDVGHDAEVRLARVLGERDISQVVVLIPTI